jgi:hypothetical protein
LPPLQAEASSTLSASLARSDTMRGCGKAARGVQIRSPAPRAKAGWLGIQSLQENKCAQFRSFCFLSFVMSLSS